MLFGGAAEAGVTAADGLLAGFHTVLKGDICQHLLCCGYEFPISVGIPSETAGSLPECCV